jgi:hypothetical protein
LQWELEALQEMEGRGSWFSNCLLGAFSTDLTPPHANYFQVVKYRSFFQLPGFLIDWSKSYDALKSRTGSSRFPTLLPASRLPGSGFTDNMTLPRGLATESG